MRTPSPSILYVDDNADSREVISLMLNIADDKYDVTTVDRADKAINLINGQNYDLYILDYRLPEIDGIELCRQIRKTDTVTPIIFYSGAAYKAEREQAIAAGANAYLVKPNDLDNLTDTVKLLLSGGGEQSQASH
ncbi:MAG: response regulator [Acidobacteriota bacterium]|nr:response regulator [Acidobacteriota bacterium]